MNDTQQTHAARLLRVVNPKQVCLKLLSTGAVIQAELDPPFSPRTHVRAHSITPFSTVAAQVCLGPYHTSLHRFLGCQIIAELPEPTYTRLDYSKHKRKPSIHTIK